MKKLLRPVSLLCAAALLVSCTSPYQAQMNALNQAYAAGQVSPDEYQREMTRMRINDAGWQQTNSNNVATGVAVGAVALGAAAILSSDDDHYHNHYHGGYGRPYRGRRHW